MSRRRSFLWTFLGLLALALLVSWVSLGVGAVRLSFAEIWSALPRPGGGSSAFIVWEYRLPRIALAWLVGAGLGVSGGVIQGVIRNPLASPDIVGVTGGAGLFAAAVMLAFPGAPLYAAPLAAFAGGISAAVCIYLFAYKRGVAPVRLALTGIAIGAVCDAGIRYLMTRFPVEVNVALSWLSGSVWGRTWAEVWVALPWVAVGVPWLILYARRLDVLALGDDVAVNLGERVGVVRTLSLLVAVALASATVAVSGTIGFVGLVAPHMARRLAGPDHRKSLPIAALLGALLMLVADAVGRGALPPLEIPAGLVTAVIGAPYFVYLLARRSSAPFNAGGE